MSKLKGPLLSLRASGKIAQAVVHSTRKQESIARALVTPANPQTAPQNQQRTAFGSAVSAWKNYMTDDAARAAMSLDRTYLRKSGSTYNVAIGYLKKAFEVRPNPGFITSQEWLFPSWIKFTCTDMLDGTPSDDPGVCRLYQSDSLSTLHAFWSDPSMAGGSVDSPWPIVWGTVRYYQLELLGVMRSGIFKVTHQLA